jgi:hypothetical protein
MASRERTQSSPKNTVSAEYTDTEFSQLRKTAKNAGISLEDLVKYRSLLDVGNIENKKREIMELKNNMTRLKAHLSVYTKSPGTGIFLPVDEKTKEEMQLALSGLIDDESPKWTFEEKLIYLGTKFPLYFFVKELNYENLKIEDN